MERNVQGIVEVVTFEEVQFDGKLDEIQGNIMRGLQAGKPLHLKIHTASPNVVESPEDTPSEAALLTPFHSPHPLDGIFPVGSTSLSQTRSGRTPRRSSSSLNSQVQRHRTASIHALKQRRCHPRNAKPPQSMNHTPKGSRIPLTPRI